MSLFAWGEYWRYRRQAMGRHGVHSPAVYSFIEEGLRPKGKSFAAAEQFESASGEAWEADELLRRITSHFRVQEIRIPGADHLEDLRFLRTAPLPTDRGRDAYDRLHDWRSLPSGNWEERIRGNIGAGDIVAVSDMHTSPEALADWNALRREPQVRLSLDLFRVGLLFFADHFKVPQHFVLKYPL